jgi:hypothetical protein
MRAHLAKYRKAYVGALTAAVVGLGAGWLPDGSMSAEEWWHLIVATLAGGGLIAVAPPNRDVRRLG